MSALDPRNSTGQVGEADAEWGSIRSLLGAEDWDTVRQGAELGACLMDDFLDAFTRGVVINDEGLIEVSDAWKRVTCLRGVNVDNAALLALSLAPDQPLARVKNLALVEHDHLNDLSPLEKAVSLEGLRIASCPGVLDLDVMAGLSGLRTLAVSDCGPLFSIPDFAADAALERLSLSNFNDSDLDPLRGLSGLRTLSLRDAPALSDISALTACTQLERVCLHGCRALLDITPLSRLSALRELAVSEAPLRLDRHGFAGHPPPLESLQLNELRGTLDLGFLSSLAPTLRSLDLFGTSALGWHALLDLDRLGSLLLPSTTPLDPSPGFQARGRLRFADSVAVLLGMGSWCPQFEGARTAPARAGAALVGVLTDIERYQDWSTVSSLIERSLAVGGPAFRRRMLAGLRSSQTDEPRSTLDQGAEASRLALERYFPERSPIRRILGERESIPRWVGDLARMLWRLRAVEPRW